MTPSAGKNPETSNTSSCICTAFLKHSTSKTQYLFNFSVCQQRNKERLFTQNKQYRRHLPLYTSNPQSHCPHTKVDSEHIVCTTNATDDSCLLQARMELHMSACCCLGKRKMFESFTDAIFWKTQTAWVNDNVQLLPTVAMCTLNYCISITLSIVVLQCFPLFACCSLLLPF